MTASDERRDVDDPKRGPEPGGGEAGGGPDEGPVTDPAHRLARWAMVLTPVLLGILVFLLLRLSTR